MTALKVGVTIGLGSLAAATAFAQQPQPAGNAQRGAEVASTCLGCHGIEGYRNAYPDYAVPRLSGQQAQYLAAALQEYKSDARQYPTMHLQAMSLSDQDIADAAAYLAGKPLAAPSSSASAPQVPQPAVVCTSCHGRDGIGVTPMYPSLAGQHASYIARAIQEYQTGYRKNPIMNGMVASLKPADITAIADYFSSLKPGLHTESRPFFRWTR
ncbi:MAG: c-type cytochrome [Gammaproteobacteria bacterium]|nr:c-type cytochrome [Gammaproteobacteria bacterium]MDE2263722.1 c-type cytochrome [Gammaproteobacteria bacterium]